jgi:uroporphyrinogen-III synthase
MLYTVVDKHLWISRPTRDGEAMAALAKEMGFVPWLMPVVDMMWLLPDREGVRALAYATSLVVTSRHALTGLQHAGIALPVQVQHWFAIGQATAQALQSLGIAAKVPAQTDSEGMLHELLADIDIGQTLVILKGEGGRTLLAERLERRGVHVVEVPVYRRICKEVEAGLVQTFLKQEWAIITVASGETLTCLLRTVPKDQLSLLQQRPLVVMSERIAQQAQQMGWRGSIAVAAEMSSLGLLQAAQSLG